MRFYVVDQDDPIIASYTRIFPDLFLPMSEMPADLLAHLRYPAISSRFRRRYILPTT